MATLWPQLRTLKRHVREARNYQSATSSSEISSWTQCQCGAWVDVDAAVLAQDGVRCGDKCTGKAKLRSVA